MNTLGKKLEESQGLIGNKTQQHNFKMLMKPGIQEILLLIGNKCWVIYMKGKNNLNGQNIGY